ncbi:hypothetical protein TIFTF001_053720 [Ficus carica]|uniref:Uncharacterized protein n=1 Tax=Ficus carica TaxID=3494 RepID=A0AA88EHW4_FICCA|nr:hypothetical protein TIFTF001_053717 [Ficus carica]GMN73600.1 hypothetical protein TIFTF001_053718 [Ficus carica]GMN73604.1 hypothetical protein TIFTF001_053719 [Ficus carica]GMN73608.1 hypothetical protein TIFTF001_053720 [Ficus carica]
MGNDELQRDSENFVYFAEYNVLDVWNGSKKKVPRLVDCPFLYLLTFQFVNNYKISGNYLFLIDPSMLADSLV